MQFERNNFEEYRIVKSKKIQLEYTQSLQNFYLLKFRSNNDFNNDIQLEILSFMLLFYIEGAIYYTLNFTRPPTTWKTLKPLMQERACHSVTMFVASKAA